MSNRSRDIEVGDIFREFGPSYRGAHKLPLHILKAMRAIEHCRTSVLGGHVDECDACGYLRISYNSCRNRHCPKCQSLSKEKWLISRQKELLPVAYFHIVFTIPDSLNDLALVNQKVIYNILFRAASETLLELGKDPRHLGGELGLICILHTWGQNLMDHPHLHCIVPGGGLSEDKWISSKGGKDFFIHVNVISDLFKKKFLSYLKTAYRAGELEFVGKIEVLGDQEAFEDLLNKLYEIKWVVYCKKPFGGPRQVLEYLGRYTHRVAISNRRIIKVADGKVTFSFRDYQDNDKLKVMSLDVFEFIRRFLLHILPNNFYKIRYHGLLSSRNKKSKLKRCKELLCVPLDEEEDPIISKSWQELLFELTGIDVRICPFCGKGRMVTKEILHPSAHAPPCEVEFAV